MVYRQVLMYGLMFCVLGCTGDRTETSPIAVIIDEQPISTDEITSADETASADETSLMDETASADETSLMDETASADETSLMDETASADETSLMDETASAAEEESVSSGPPALFQELRVLSELSERDRVGFKNFTEREVPLPQEFLDPSEATRLFEEGRQFFSEQEATRLLEEGEIFLSQEEVTTFLSEEGTTTQSSREQRTTTQSSETEAYLNAGIAHYERGNYLRAIEFLQYAVDRKIGDLGRAYHYLGLVYFAQQDYDQAIENYDEAIERGVIEAYRQRGNAYSSIGNFRQANEDYTAYQRLSE